MSTDWIIFIIMMIVLVLVLIVVIWNELRFKHRVIIKEVANGRKLIHYMRARDYTDSSRITWWLLKGEKDKIKRKCPVPPNTAIDIMKKGKKFAMAYRTEQGEYVWVSDDAKMMDLPPDFIQYIKTVPEHIKKIKDDVERDAEYNAWKYHEIREYMKKENIIQPIKPVTQGQRMALVNNVQKAEERSQKDWKKDIPLYASLGIFVIIFVCALLFMPDLVKVVREGNQEVLNGIQVYEKMRHDNFMKEGLVWKEITDKITYVTNVEEENKKAIEALKQRNDQLEAQISGIKP